MPRAAVFGAQPLTVEQVRAGELGAGRCRAQAGDRLLATRRARSSAAVTAAGHAIAGRAHGSRAVRARQFTADGQLAPASHPRRPRRRGSPRQRSELLVAGHVAVGHAEARRSAASMAGLAHWRSSRLTRTGATAARFSRSARKAAREAKNGIVHPSRSAAPAASEKPCPAASLTDSPSSRDLPMPGSPSTRTTPPAPRRARRSNSPTARRSASRPYTTPPSADHTGSPAFLPILGE